MEGSGSIHDRVKRTFSSPASKPSLALTQIRIQRVQYFFETMWDTRHLKHRGPPRPLTGIALLSCVVFIVCNVSFIVCVALCSVFYLKAVCFL
jgi:hypothetical protein